MASQFVGFPVLVTLKSPPNCRVQGTVADVVGQRLTLHDVTLLWNGQRAPVYHIAAAGIADLEIVPQPAGDASTGYAPSEPGKYASTTDFQAEQQLQTRATPVPVSSAPPPPPPPTQIQHQPFVDPAILSFARPPRAPPSLQTNIPRDDGRVVASPVMIGESEASEVARAKMATPAPITPIPAFRHTSDIPPATTATAATLTAPFSDLELNSGNDFPGDKENGRVGGVQQGESVPEGRKHAGPLEAPLKYTGKRSRRGGRGKLQKEGGLQGTGIPEGNEPDPAMSGQRKTGFTGKGWRQTAFMEPADSMPSPSPRNGRGRQSRNRRSVNHEEAGWATEDATDIQELGDFDFESNLSKFDKRRVFDEIKNDDTKPSEDRLISINRRPRPGTNNGRNLHYTENVLDPVPPQNLGYISESGETDEGTDGPFHNVRNTSRARSRASVHAPQSRKGSAILGASATSSQFGHISRGPVTSSRTTSPRSHMQGATPSASPITRSAESVHGSLQITTTSRKCPIVSPFQMLEVEQVATSELGLTDDMITENSGRGIAEAAVSLTRDLPVSSQILVLAGNHRTGSRAVSAARHLRNRGYRVTLCILGADRETEFTDAFRKQTDIFKKAGGRVMRWEQISTRLSTVDNTPALVIDALFGVHIAFEDLRTDDQTTAFEMISWANRSGAEILSVDIPFGLSPTSGEATLVQGTRLCINASYVVCLGAPKTGLVNALAAGEGASWQIAVTDVGISQGAWKKLGTRRRHGVDFGNKWVVPLRYLPATA